MTCRENHGELDSLRARLRNNQGKEYWRSLEELAETPKFRSFLEREFPVGASEWNDPVGRRRFLKLMSASIALAGATACTIQPTEHVVPYVKPIEGLVPGQPTFYATAFPLHGIGEGLLVESHEGRPTKIEGNANHPGSLGAASVQAQASILGLYDPDRSQTVTYLGNSWTWGEFLNQSKNALDAQRGKQGTGLRILTETVTSPTLAAQLKALLTEYPNARWHQYESCGRESARAGAMLAFGQPVNTVYHFDKADIVLSLDSDFLTSGPGFLRYARDFMGRRRLTDGSREMNRLYVVESTPSPTGAKADHRLRLRHSEIAQLARAVAAGLGASGGEAAAPDNPRIAWIKAVVNDLGSHRGKSIVIAGDRQPPEVHALAHAINQELGNVGETVVHTEPLEAKPVNGLESITELTRDIESGLVEMLVIIEANQVYGAPVDLDFGKKMAKVPLRIRLGLYNDETSELCHWHLPEAHYLEAWSDIRGYDGTVSILQPLVTPLYYGKSPHELLATLLNAPEQNGRQIVQDYWKSGPSGSSSGDFDKTWQGWLEEGVIPNTALNPMSVSVKGDWSQGLTRNSPSSLDIVYRPDPNVVDGQFANNGWLQELPKPITKLTWDNAALMSAGTAVKVGLTTHDRPHAANGKMVSLETGGRRENFPVWVVPGHADDSVTVFLGYGRKRAGNVATGIGFNAFNILSSGAPLFATDLKAQPTGDFYELAPTQEHFSLEGLEDRHIVRTANLETYAKRPDFAQREGENPPQDLSLFPSYEYKGYAWGMAIDQQSCVGCNACVIACQSENNIAIVGKEQVINNREMHWLRIDTYLKGEVESPETYFQPMLCQHCERAPCELVCPVNATVHDAEGLNVQVYNRCIGTRYCSNNCPYKVRRFNFFLYGDWTTPSLKMLRNPDVSVRSRGVMEKCTYCVQRIMEAKIQSEKEDRQVRDGEIVTACQATCPTEAIVFGNINDPSSRVSKLKNEPRNYAVLAELGTHPRTTYLASVRNPNPEIASGLGQEPKEHG
jgi:MoCo/4Fe-4S cofactor protein with predicted Tat translocation signal